MHQPPHWATNGAINGVGMLCTVATLYGVFSGTELATDGPWLLSFTCALRLSAGWRVWGSGSGAGGSGRLLSAGHGKARREKGGRGGYGVLESWLMRD